MKPTEAYILKQEQPYKSILLQLQAIIEACASNTELFFKWGIPFYYCNGIPLCYLNQSKDYVDLAFLEHVLPAFFNEDKDGILKRALITKNGELTNRFKYLQDFVDGKLKYKND